MDALAANSGKHMWFPCAKWPSVQTCVLPLKMLGLPETKTASLALTRVKKEKIRKGRILGGVQGYLEGIFGDPSLTKNPG